MRRLLHGTFTSAPDDAVATGLAVLAVSLITNSRYSPKRQVVTTTAPAA